MEWLWTWGGECFGYRRGDRLFTHDGRHIGQFHEDDVYDANGRYLGELRNSNRLITNTRKKNRIKSGFSPVPGASWTRYANYAGYAMTAGHEDFPAPEAFR